MQDIMIQSSRGIKLSAAFYPNKTNKAIIICHGFTSGKDRERHIKNAQTLHQAGFVVIRFDFGGCGKSEETLITVDGQIQDLNSIISFLEDKNYTQIAIVAESLGGLIASKAYSEKITSIVFWAPVTDRKDSILEEFIIKKNESIVNKGGSIEFSKRGKVHFIPEKYFQERANVNQEQLMTNVQCPVLIIHGNKDTTVPLEMSVCAIKYLSKESKLEIIDQMDHTFVGFEDKIIELTLDWITKYF